MGSKSDLHYLKENTPFSLIPNVVHLNKVIGHDFSPLDEVNKITSTAHFTVRPFPRLFCLQKAPAHVSLLVI